MLRALALCAVLPACSTAGTGIAAHSLSWMAGCWTDGTTTERWTYAGDGYLFGHNVVMSAGKVQFFEQLRIEPGATGPVLQAYPRGVGPVAFVSAESGDSSVGFVNESHDFPQRIAYTRAGEVLTATVSLIDGSKAGSWVYRRCENY